jgi:hypothetical protein
MPLIDRLHPAIRNRGYTNKILTKAPGLRGFEICEGLQIDLPQPSSLKLRLKRGEKRVIVLVREGGLGLYSPRF